MRREPDAHDRRRVNVVATEQHYARSEEIWGPLMEDWHRALGRLPSEELRAIAEFLRATAELGARHAERLRDDPPLG